MTTPRLQTHNQSIIIHNILIGLRKHCVCLSYTHSVNSVAGERRHTLLDWKRTSFETKTLLLLSVYFLSQKSTHLWVLSHYEPEFKLNECISLLYMVLHPSAQWSHSVVSMLWSTGEVDVPRAGPAPLMIPAIYHSASTKPEPHSIFVPSTTAETGSHLWTGAGCSCISKRNLWNLFKLTLLKFTQADSSRSNDLSLVEFALVGIAPLSCH